ncbi:MAG: hypothetical protein AAGA50_14900 [Pseudomonadota bacterium]
MTRFHLHAVRIARELSELGLEVPHQVHFNQVFATLPGNEEKCEQIVANVQASGEALFGSATWQGRTSFRISVSNWTTSDDDVDRLVSAIKDAQAQQS